MPFVRALGLKPAESKPYPIWKNDQYGLIVSGMGSGAMACAVGYFCGRYRPRGLLNVGIAGHSQHAIGKGFLVDACYSGDARILPSITWKMPSASLLTVDAPTHHEEHMTDMEGFAFFEAAGRFLTIESIQSYKIISDNAPMDVPAKNWVEELIAPHLETVREILQQIPVAARIDVDTTPFVENTHFTQTEREQLKMALQRLQARKTKAKDIIARLQ